MAKIDDDYISREVAIDTIDSLYFDAVDVNVREVIFCRDCRHYYEEHSNIWKEPLCYCRKWLCSHPTLPEGFCNYGEAKT